MGKFEVTKVHLLDGAPRYESVCEGTKKACINYKKLLDSTLSEKYKRVFVREENSVYICSETEFLIVTINQ